MTTPQLDYAPTPQKFLKRHRRLTTLVIVLIAVAVLLNHYRGELEFRARRLYWYRPCARFIMPANVLLEEPDSKRAAALAASNPDYLLVRYSSKTVAVYSPRCWREYSTVEPRSVSLRGQNYQPIIFLHELHMPSGKPRLVVVTGGWRNAYDLHIWTDRIVLPPPALFEPHPPPGAPSVFAYGGPYLEATLSPGTVDPTDASHFWINFTFNFRDTPHHGTLDGYLQNDDTIHFKFRDPATTQKF